MTRTSFTDACAPERARPTTMLDLVEMVNRSTSTVAETVERVVALIEGGQFRLCGSFAGARLDRAVIPNP